MSNELFARSYEYLKACTLVKVIVVKGRANKRDVQIEVQQE